MGVGACSACSCVEGPVASTKVEAATQSSVVRHLDTGKARRSDVSREPWIRPAVDTTSEQGLSLSAQRSVQSSCRRAPPHAPPVADVGANVVTILTVQRQPARASISTPTHVDADPVVLVVTNLEGRTVATVACGTRDAVTDFAAMTSSVLPVRTLRELRKEVARQSGIAADAQALVFATRTRPEGRIGSECDENDALLAEFLPIDTEAPSIEAGSGSPSHSQPQLQPQNQESEEPGREQPPSMLQRRGLECEHFLLSDTRSKGSKDDLTQQTAEDHQLVEPLSLQASRSPSVVKLSRWVARNKSEEDGHSLQNPQDPPQGESPPKDMAATTSARRRPMALTLEGDEAIDAKPHCHRRPTALSTVGEDEEASVHEMQQCSESEQPAAIVDLATESTSASTSTSAVTRFVRPMSLDSQDSQVDDNPFLSKSWSADAAGLCHKPTGLQISRDKGICIDGQTWTLAPSELEIVDNGTLGSGAGGSVQLALHKPSGAHVAIKIVRVESKDKRDQMLREIAGLIQAQGCPFLVQWFAGYPNADMSIVNVVLEYMNLGSLRDLQRRMGKDALMPASRLACASAQIVRGLRFLQERSMLHRDIKPENVLHNKSGRVKLTDFGISKSVGGTLSGIGTTFVGTAIYMSPERVKGEDYSYPSDVWSVGMVVYELAAGRHPFHSCSFLELYDNVCECPEPRLEGQGSYPAALCDFVARCLTRNVLYHGPARPSVGTLVSHEFISRGVEEPCIANFADWLTSLAAPIQK